MILTYIKLLPKSKWDGANHWVYKYGKGFILGVYGQKTARYYSCDKNGKKLNNRLLKFNLKNI